MRKTSLEYLKKKYKIYDQYDRLKHLHAKQLTDIINKYKNANKKGDVKNDMFWNDIYWTAVYRLRRIR